eukprot:6934204-Prorocentrum_lima.AAC.1
MHLARMTPPALLLPTLQSADNAVLQAAADIAETPLDADLETILRVPVAHGGFGLGDLQDRAHAAYVAAWLGIAPWLAVNFPCMAPPLTVLQCMGTLKQKAGQPVHEILGVEAAD